MKLLTNMVFGLALAGAMPMSAIHAEEGIKALPTLLIKGEVVSLNTGDPAATLLTVKDRYGFETPIYLTPETKLTKGEGAAATSDLTASTAVEVEYNFDVNTAKRHAVSVKLSAPAVSEAPAAIEQPVAAAAPEVPATQEPVAPPVSEVVPSEPVVQ